MNISSSMKMTLNRFPSASKPIEKTLKNYHPFSHLESIIRQSSKRGCDMKELSFLLPANLSQPAPVSNSPFLSRSRALARRVQASCCPTMGRNSQVRLWRNNATLGKDWKDMAKDRGWTAKVRVFVSIGGIGETLVCGVEEVA